MNQAVALITNQETAGQSYTTTTAISLHPENETRYFSVEVDDTPKQTSRVLLATAENINKDSSGNCKEEIGKFLALQEWLGGANHEVVIPYAKRLAERIPPVAVRLRRDFKAILHLIMSHAILHQASREQDDRGRIIATIEDYKVVWDLVAPIVSRGVQMTVPATMRETVQAVEKLEQEMGEGLVENLGAEMGGASLMDVANILHLNRSTVSRRVNACLEEGYLVNRETKRGQPFRLVVGDPLPDDAEVLPTPESLAGSCSLAGDSEGIDPPLPPALYCPGRMSRLKPWRYYDRKTGTTCNRVGGTWVYRRTQQGAVDPLPALYITSCALAIVGAYDATLFAGV